MNKSAAGGPVFIHARQFSQRILVYKVSDRYVLMFDIFFFILPPIQVIKRRFGHFAERVTNTDEWGVEFVSSIYRCCVFDVCTVLDGNRGSVSAASVVCQDERRAR